jgi:copper homeostasis protein
MEIIRNAAARMQLTFHRAFDLVADPDAALKDLLAIGCDRLLTSGCARSAVEGQVMLRRLVHAAKGRIAVVAAAGLSASNVGGVIEYARVNGVHAGTAVTRLATANAAHVETVVSMANSDRGRVDAFPRVDACLVQDFAIAARDASARCHARADENRTDASSH